MTRNAECVGYPHSMKLGCGWKGERFPSIQMTREIPFSLLPGSYLIYTDEWIEAISTKPCPRCGGQVLPICTENVGWPAERKP